MINRLLTEKVREVKRSQLCLIEGRSSQKPPMTNNSQHAEICQRELLGGGGGGGRGGEGGSNCLIPRGSNYFIARVRKPKYQQYHVPQTYWLCEGWGGGGCIMEWGGGGGGEKW